MVVLDEAGLVGTRALTRLLEHVATAGGKAVLVGDPAQLPEIEAGGLFGALAARASAPELTGNRRQRLDWERTALSHLRAGRTGIAMVDYVRHDRVHLAEPEAVVATLATDYLALRDTAASPFDVIALASRRSDVAALNAAIRDRRRDRGELGGAEVALPGPTGPLRVAVGELVLVTRNDSDRGVHNGTRAIVTSLSPGGLELSAEDGARLAVPTGWAAERLAHAYAMTVHKAQGLTVEACLLYGTRALSQQAGYVALSRGRAANHLYTSLDRETGGGNGWSPGYQPVPIAELRPLDIVGGLIRQLAADPGHRLASSQRPRRDPRLPPAVLVDDRTETGRRELEPAAINFHRSRDRDYGRSR